MPLELDAVGTRQAYALKETAKNSVTTIMTIAFINDDHTVGRPPNQSGYMVAQKTLDLVQISPFLIEPSRERVPQVMEGEVVFRGDVKDTVGEARDFITSDKSNR